MVSGVFLRSVCPLRVASAQFKHGRRGLSPRRCNLPSDGEGVDEGPSSYDETSRKRDGPKSLTPREAREERAV